VWSSDCFPLCMEFRTLNIGESCMTEGLCTCLAASADHFFPFGLFVGGAAGSELLTGWGPGARSLKTPTREGGVMCKA
jgi:hypothetical protein